MFNPPKKIYTASVATLFGLAAVSGAVAYPTLAQEPAASVSANPSPVKGDAMTTLIGKPAPSFTLPDQNNRPVSLESSRGKWVVLAFYPKDMTPGCTLQNKSYSAKADAFAPSNAVVYTISTQDTASKQAFCAKEGLKNTLLSDVGGKVAKLYGTASGEYARRVTFYIRPNGTVAFVDTKPNVAQAAEDSLATLARLSEQDKTATQAGASGVEVRTQAGGAPAVTAQSKAVFVGPNAIKVTMGALIPDFSLPEAGTGKTTAYSTLAAGKQAMVITFISTQCPVSNDYNERMVQLSQTYGAKGVRFVGINANSTEASDAVATHAKTSGFDFTVLKDANNRVADQFEAKVTPEVYIVDKTGVLVYHGPIDDNRDGTKVQKRYVADALDAVLSDKPVPVKEARAFGCSIKRAK